MPPPKSHLKMTSEEIGILECWIRGAQSIRQIGLLRTCLRWTRCDCSAARAWISPVFLRTLKKWNVSPPPASRRPRNAGASYIRDLQATMLHLLGIDHTALTHVHQSRRSRLTDVHGHVVKDLLA